MKQLSKRELATKIRDRQVKEKRKQATKLKVANSYWVDVTKNNIIYNDYYVSYWRAMNRIDITPGIRFMIGILGIFYVPVLIMELIVATIIALTVMISAILYYVLVIPMLIGAIFTGEWDIYEVVNEIENKRCKKKQKERGI